MSEEREEYKFDHFKNIDEVMYYFNYWYKEEDVYSINRYLSLKDFNYISNKYQELQKENEQLKEKVKYQKNKIDNKDKWCQLIVDIGFDYDGCNTIESLKGLIDELVRYALNSRDNYDYEEILKGE